MKKNLLHWGWALFVAFGCSSGGDDNPSSPSANLAPQDLCAKKCQLEVSAGCAQTPPDYLASCTSICLAKYTKHPNCESTMRPLDVCAIDRVSYGCMDDVIRVTPSGGCAAEAAACIGCTGDFMECL
jgi:hypothetical protein